MKIDLQSVDTQAQVAMVVGVSQPAISALVSGGKLLGDGAGGPGLVHCLGVARRHRHGSFQANFQHG